MCRATKGGLRRRRGERYEVQRGDERDPQRGRAGARTVVQGRPGGRTVDQVIGHRGEVGRTVGRVGSSALA